jgi:uncharacterized metal-binding protein
VGQISGRAAIQFEGEEIGKFSCLAGIGGNVSMLVENAENTSKRIVIDGCPTSCGEATLERTGMETDFHVVAKVKECLFA